METSEGTSICIFNARGLIPTLQSIDQLSKEVPIIGIRETWLREKDTAVIQAVDGSTEAPTLRGAHRGLGRVGLIVNPLLPYRIVAKHSETTIQSLTAQIHSTMITVLYVSPAEKWPDEHRILEDIH